MKKQRNQRPEANARLLRYREITESCHQENVLFRFLVDITLPLSRLAQRHARSSPRPGSKNKFNREGKRDITDFAKIRGR
jgi:hypothetical protein